MNSVEKNIEPSKDCKKTNLSMVTMSEAAWDRNEERHRKEKKFLLIAFVVAVFFAVSTTFGWLLAI